MRRKKKVSRKKRRRSEERSVHPGEQLASVESAVDAQEQSSELGPGEHDVGDVDGSEDVSDEVSDASAQDDVASHEEEVAPEPSVVGEADGNSFAAKYEPSSLARDVWSYEPKLSEIVSGLFVESGRGYELDVSALEDCVSSVSEFCRVLRGHFGSIEKEGLGSNIVRDTLVLCDGLEKYVRACLVIAKKKLDSEPDAWPGSIGALDRLAESYRGYIDSGFSLSVKLASSALVEALVPVAGRTPDATSRLIMSPVCMLHNAMLSLMAAVGFAVSIELAKRRDVAGLAVKLLGPSIAAIDKRAAAYAAVHMDMLSGIVNR